MKFDVLAKSFQQLESTSKRLEKTHIISSLLKETDDDHLQPVLLLLRGQIYPDFDQRDIGISNKLAIKAMNTAFGYSEDDIKNKWREIGDLGEIAKELSTNKKQNTLFQKDLNVKNIFKTLQELPRFTGHGSTDQKIKQISKLLGHAKPLEAKYITRIVLQDLRVGIAEGTIRDGMAWAYLDEVKPHYDEKQKSITPKNREKYNEAIELIQDCLNKTNDFYQVAKATKKGINELQKIDLQIGKPLKSMLAKRSKNAKDAFDTTGRPSALEYKYDGLRMQIHYKDEKVQIFTRRLDDVTKQFPEVQRYVKENVNCTNCILDAEAVGYNSKTKKYTKFQEISQRIKRKYDIKKLSKKIPVELNIFDILYHNNESQIKKTYQERRQLLEKIITKKPLQIVPAKQIITKEISKAQEFFEQALNEGNEGLMFKKLDAIYKPGNRVGYMVKYKTHLDDLDLVITGAEWGTGKRKGWLTSLLVSCYNQELQTFEEIGKVGTGLKEKGDEGTTFQEITNQLKKYITKTTNREVTITPKIVISVRFEEIQKSTAYTSGYALRFPRFKQLRPDRKPESIATKKEVKQAYQNQ